MQRAHADFSLFFANSTRLSNSVDGQDKPVGLE
jgi:hypothetical protein